MLRTWPGTSATAAAAANPHAQHPPPNHLTTFGTHKVAAQHFPSAAGAVFKSRGLMLSTLTRSGLEPVAVEARAVYLLRAALTDFAACQESVSISSNLSQTHPFVYSRPNSSLAVSLKLPS